LKNSIRAILTVMNTKEKNRLVLLIFFNTIIHLTDVFSVVCLLFVVKFYTQPFVVNIHNLLLTGIFSDKKPVLPVLILLLLFIVKNVAGHFVYKSQVQFICNVSVRISQQNLSDYLEGAYSNYANVDSAVFVNKIVHQPTEFAQYILQSFQQIITELLLIAFSATALMIYNAKLVIIVFFTLLPGVIILSWLTKKRLGNIKKNIRIVVEQSLQYLNEALRGYVESNIYNRNTFFVNRHTEVQNRVGTYITDIQVTQDMPARFFEVFAILGLFVLIVVIKYGRTIHNTDVVLIGAFMAAAYKIIPSITKIINLTGLFRTYRYTIEETDKSCLVRQAKRVSGRKIESIEFRDIHFSYNGIKIFNGFNCRINAGSFAGICGDSGSGKTTLLQLLLGFNRESSGSVLFNGEIVDDSARISHWNTVAYVKQDPFILHNSILNNIVLFDNEYEKCRLNEIFEVTGLNEMADKFPEGFYKLVGEGGKRLSGGQRKRIAIARALYKDSDLILLDEPFSELDELSEIRMLQYLKKLSLKGKMIILISHNRSSFQLCDMVINV